MLTFIKKQIRYVKRSSYYIKNKKGQIRLHVVINDNVIHLHVVIYDNVGIKSTNCC